MADRAAWKRPSRMPRSLNWADRIAFVLALGLVIAGVGLHIVKAVPVHANEFAFGLGMAVISLVWLGEGTLRETNSRHTGGG